MHHVGAINQQRAARAGGAHRGALPFLKTLLGDARLLKGKLHDGNVLGQFAAHYARRAMRQRDVAQIEEHLHLSITPIGARRQHRVIGVVGMERLRVLRHAGVFREGLGLIEPDIARLKESFRHRDDGGMQGEAIENLLGEGKFLQADELQRPEPRFVAGILRRLSLGAIRGAARVGRAGVERLGRRIELEESGQRRVDLARGKQMFDQHPTMLREMREMRFAVSCIHGRQPIPFGRGATRRPAAGGDVCRSTDS